MFGMFRQQEWKDRMRKWFLNKWIRGQNKTLHRSVQECDGNRNVGEMKTEPFFIFFYSIGRGSLGRNMEKCKRTFLFLPKMEEFRLKETTLNEVSEQNFGAN